MATDPDLPARLHAALDALGDLPAMRRLRLRLDELGDDHRDEVRQFRLLQRACREDADVVGALDSIGWTDVAGRGTVPMDAETGAMVQAFNAMVERFWEDE